MVMSTNIFWRFYVDRNCVDVFSVWREGDDTGMPDGIDCTLEFRNSATINVSDPNGDPLASEFVPFSTR